MSAPSWTPWGIPLSCSGGCDGDGGDGDGDGDGGGGGGGGVSFGTCTAGMKLGLQVPVVWKAPRKA